MSTPPLHAEVRAKVLEYIEAAYLHGLPAENLDTGELEPPRDIADVEWIADRVLQAVADALLAAAKAEKRQLIEPVTKRVVTDGDKVGIDLDADTKGSLVFIQDNGFNQGVDAVTRVISELKGQS